MNKGYRMLEQLRTMFTDQEILDHITWYLSDDEMADIAEDFMQETESLSTEYEDIFNSVRNI